jgi:conjugal transfer pilus assembly protein TraK
MRAEFAAHAVVMGIMAVVVAAPISAGADGMPPETATAAPASPQDAPVQRAAVGINDVLVTPGQTQAVRVALGHINRIVTPFRSFDLWTESPEEFQSRGAVLYVSPTSKRPVTLFVTPKGDESLAISLTLVPDEVPPTEVHLRLADASGALILTAALGGEAAPSTPSPLLPAATSPSFESGPYEESIAAVVKEIAAGQVPAGYAAAPMTAVFPRCRARAGLAVAFDGGQRFVGAPFEVFIGVVRNTGSGPVAFDETWCAAPDVAAVALWPDVELAPGAAAEVMVLRRRASASPTPSRTRPSLIPTGAALR